MPRLVSAKETFGLLSSQMCVALNRASNCFISEKGRNFCLYDQNGIPCCTKKLDLFFSWQDQGWVEGHGPFDSLLQNEDRLAKIKRWVGFEKVAIFARRFAL